MTKKEFINDPDVIKFIIFLAKIWNDDFSFNMGIKAKGKPARYRQIASLKDAYKNYFWQYSIKDSPSLPKYIKTKCHTLENSNEVLDYCKNKLIVNGQLNDNEEELKEASVKILEWGGVTKGNKKKVEDRNFSLINTYQDVLDEWSNINQNNQKHFSPKSNVTFPCNAGFTKIYSLLLENFIIYDSRVSVALAFLLEVCFGNNIPNSLELFIPSSQITEKEKRAVNPFFKSTNQDAKRHFNSNVKCSLLLSEVVEIIKKEDSSINLRQIESSLFMIGYDIRN